MSPFIRRLRRRWAARWRKPPCRKCGGDHRTALHDYPRRFGARRGEAQGTVVVEACELGYECPFGHYDFSGNPVFSEFESHLWCFECGNDYPTSACPIQDPGWYEEGGHEKFLARLRERGVKLIVKFGKREGTE